jgi:hypothetical protein
MRSPSSISSQSEPRIGVSGSYASMCLYYDLNREVELATSPSLSTTAASRWRVATAFRALARRFRETAAFFPAARRLRVAAAFRPAARRLRVVAAFLPAVLRFLVAAALFAADNAIGKSFLMLQQLPSG